MGTSAFDKMWDETPAKRTGFDDLWDNNGVRPSTPEAARMRAIMSQPTAPPDQAAEAVRVGRRANIPATAALESLDALKAMQSAGEFDADTFVRDNPATSRWLTADPINAAVARDDFESLSKTERIFGRYQVTGFGTDLATGRGTFPSITQVQRGTVQAAFGQAPEMIQLSRLYANTTAEQRRQPEVRAQVDALRAQMPTMPDPSVMANPVEASLRFFAEGFVPSMGYIAGSAGVGAMSGAAGGALAGAVGGPAAGVTAGMGATVGAGVGAFTAAREFSKAQIAMTLDEVRDENGRPLSDRTIDVASETYGVLGGMLELGGYNLVGRQIANSVARVGATEMAERAAKNATTNLLTQVTGRRVATEVAKTMAVGVAVETGEEVAAEFTAIGTEALARIAGNVQGGQFGPVENVTERLLTTAYQTALGSIWFGGLAGGAVGIGGMNRLRQAQEDAEVLTELSENAAMSKLRQRDPEKYAEVIAAQTPEGLEKVGMEAERLVMLLQEASIPLAQFAEVAGITEQEVQEAIASGGDVYLPMPQVMSRLVGTPIFEGMKLDLKLRPDGMSQREADVMAKEVEAESAALQTEMEAIVQNGTEDASGQRVIDELVAQITAATEGQPKSKRFTEANIEQTARGIAAFYITQAQRTGVDAYELYASRGYSILGRQQGEGLYDAVQELRRLRTEGTPEQVKEAEAKVRQQGEMMAQASAPDPLADTPTLYHGSPRRFESFDFARLGTGAGTDAAAQAMFLTDNPAIARFFSKEAPGDASILTRLALALGVKKIGTLEPSIYEVKVQLQNPKIVDFGGRYKEDINRILAEAKAEGHDGVVFQNIKDGPEIVHNVTAVFAPEGIKRFNRAGEPVTAQERTDFLAQEGMQETLGETIDVDGVSRPTTNSTGQPIHPTAEGVRNFYRWFGSSKVVDAEGRPLVVYHGTRESFDAPNDWTFATPKPEVASAYAERTESEDGQASGPNVMPLYMALRGPLVIDAKGEKWHSVEYDGVAMSTDDIAGMVQENGMHDGVIFENINDGAGAKKFVLDTVYVSFEDVQVKSALGNSGAFGPSADILMQAEPRLQVLHNLTADNLKFAEQMGGLAVPSLGVTREGMSFPTMGEITLIGTRDLADPEQNPVYTADAYTVTFPRPEYKKAKSKDALALYRKFTDESKRFDDSLANELSDNALGGRPDKSIEMMLRSPAAIATFLAEKGVTLDPVMFPEQREYNNVDRWASRDVALKALEGYEAEYKEWVENEVLPMHGEPFLKVGRKKVPYTIDNIVEVMTGQGAAAEQTMTFGSGKAAAAAAKQIGSLTEMRNRAEYALGTAEEVAEGRKVSEEALKAYRDAVVPYHGGSTWDALDASMRAIAKFARGRGIKEALRSEGFTSVPNDVLELGKVAGRALLEAPVPYFEAKVERAVSLSEFAGAVIPSNADEGTRKILADAGVQVAEYELGDDAGRNSAIAQLNTQLSGAGMQTLFQGTGRPNAFIIPGVGQQTIALMNGANLSSLLHEFSHDWLVILGEQAAKPDAPAQVRADYAELLKQLGVASTAEIGVEQQENFARMWERYYATAEAPSRALARVFTSFKRWMQKVYKDVREMFVPVSPEVARLFDRMIATDAELELARGANGSGAMLTEADGETLGATPDEMEGYAKAVLWRTAQEEARLIKAVVEDEGKETTEQYQAEAESVRAEVRAELEAQPVHRAFKFLREPDANGKSVKLNVEQYEAEHGKRPRGLQGIWSTAEKAPFAKKEGADVIGTDVESMALAYGFRDGTAFIDALRAMEDLEVAVERRVREEMRVRFPDLTPFSQPLADEAQRVQHLADTDDVLVRELNLLAKSSGIRAPNVQAVKRAAKAIIAKLKVRDIRPIVYQNAEAKAARLSMEAFKAGDPEKAAFHKRQQLLNHILYREAVKQQERVGVIQRFAKRMIATPTQERMGKAGKVYQDALNSLLQSYDFRNIPLRNLDALEYDRQPRLNKTAALNAYKEAALEDALVVASIPASVSEQEGVVNYQQLSVMELDNVYSVMHQVYETASRKDKALRENEKRNLQEQADAFVESVTSLHTLTERPIDYYPLSLSNAKQKLAAVDAWHLPPEFLFVWLDGDTTGTAYTLFFKPFAEAEAEEFRRGEIAFKEMQRIEEMIDLPSVLTDTSVAYEGIRSKMTKRSIIALALNMGTESGVRASLEAQVDGKPQFGSYDAILAMFAQTLTEADWKYITAKWDYANTFWPDIAELERQTNGIIPQKLEAAPFFVRTADGKDISVKGGYYPLSYASAKLGAGGAVKVIAQVAGLEEGVISPSGGARAQTMHGWTEERVKASGRPINLDLNVWNGHIVNVIHDLTHRKAVRDVYRLYKRKDVRQTIEQSAGQEAYNALMPWLARIANPNQSFDNSFAENTIARARAGVTAVNMGLSVSVAMVQPLGYLQAADVIGPMWVAKGIAASFSPNFKSVAGAVLGAAAYGSTLGPAGTAVGGLFGAFVGGLDKASADVLERSVAMRQRREDFSRDARDYVKTRKNRLNGFEKFYFSFIGMMDNAVMVPVWIGAYRKAMAENGGNDGEAVQYADSVIRRSQGAGSPKDLSRVQGGPELRRMLTIHYSFMSRQYGLFRRTATNLAEGRMTKARVLASVAMIGVLSPILSELVAGRPPEDDEEWLPWAMLQVMQGAAGSIVLLRDVARALGPKAFPYKISPVEDALKKTVGAIQTVGEQTVGQLFSDEDTDLTESELKEIVETIGYWTRTPTRAVWRVVTSFTDWMQGYDVESADFIRSRPR
jgi:hypothetical protein